MARHRWTLIAIPSLILVLGPATYAYGAVAEVPPALSMNAGILMLLAAAVLLREMLALRTLARGAAVAENVSYVVLAVLCLVSSVLLGWVARFVPTGFSADHARLGADLLSTVATVLFVVYFARVRGVMKRYLKYLTGEKQLLTAVMSEEQ